MRIGKNVEHLKAAAVASEAKGGDQFLKYCIVGRQLGYAGYLTLDTMCVPDAIGAWKSERAKTLGAQAYKSWFMGLTFSAISGIYALYKLREREAGLSKEDGESAVESKRIQR